MGMSVSARNSAASLRPLNTKAKKLPPPELALPLLVGAAAEDIAGSLGLAARARSHKGGRGTDSGDVTASGNNTASTISAPVSSQMTAEPAGDVAVHTNANSSTPKLLRSQRDGSAGKARPPVVTSRASRDASIGKLNGPEVFSPPEPRDCSSTAPAPAPALQMSSTVVGDWLNGKRLSTDMLYLLLRARPSAAATTLKAPSDKTGTQLQATDSSLQFPVPLLL
mmetsp:Transcript_25581/g.73049  ORF Transcript_25581/g.73049 Transcript_25581/m.73049 type:complete len:224 (-) Transcript_25581:792-1463(-)